MSFFKAMTCLCLVLIAVFSIGCTQTRQISAPPRAIIPEAYPTASFKKLVDAMPANASVDSLKALLPPILKSIYVMPVKQTHQLPRGLEKLRQQPKIITALVSIYSNVPRESTGARLFIISFLGELRRSDGIAFLKKIVWEPLPAQETSPHLTKREKEEAIQAKAVQGLAYLRTSSSDLIVLEIISTHPSKLVRTSGIDAFLWNHGNDPAAIKAVLEKVRPGEEIYTEMQHFERSISAEHFNQILRQWRKKYKPK